MTVGLEKREFLIFKRFEEVSPETKYYFTPPPKILKRFVVVVSGDEVSVRDTYLNGGKLTVKPLIEKKINKENLFVPDENGKLVRLIWKKS